LTTVKDCLTTVKENLISIKDYLTSVKDLLTTVKMNKYTSRTYLKSLTARKITFMVSKISCRCMWNYKGWSLSYSRENSLL